MINMTDIASGIPLLRHDITTITSTALHYYSQVMIVRPPLWGPLNMNSNEPLEA